MLASRIESTPWDSPLWSFASATVAAYLLLLVVLGAALLTLRRYRPRHARRRSMHPFARAAAALLPLAILAVPAAAGRCDGPAPADPYAVASAPAVGQDRISGAGVRPSGAHVRPSGARTLVLYDADAGPEGELAAVHNANLASHFGPWDVRRLSQYRPGTAAGYAAVLLAGVGSGTKVPPALLDDVLGGTVPVLWAGAGLDPARLARYGIRLLGSGRSDVTTVRYKGVDLTRTVDNGADVARVEVGGGARILATGYPRGVAGGGTPWAVSSGNLLYVTENPFLHADTDDRYLAYTDLLFDVLDPGRAERHRALVRLEDVGPEADPRTLREIGEYLYRHGIPFSVAVFPVHDDPAGAYAGGEPERITMAQRPRVAAALKYLRGCGGTLLLHGLSHQYGHAPNPYRGVSAEDYEFYLAHIDHRDNVILDGPVPDDSPEWASRRIAAAVAELHRARLPTPTVFEFPHYAGSAADYRVATAAFGARYERSLYFPGTLTGRAGDHREAIEQFYPYPVRDVYGGVVVPEDLGNYVPVAINNRPDRHPADVVASARRARVVRDGFASFFYHPYLGLKPLAEIVSGIREAGFTFVTPAEAVPG